MAFNKVKYVLSAILISHFVSSSEVKEKCTWHGFSVLIHAELSFEKRPNLLNYILKILHINYNLFNR